MTRILSLRSRHWQRHCRSTDNIVVAKQTGGSMEACVIPGKPITTPFLMVTAPSLIRVMYLYRDADIPIRTIHCRTIELPCVGIR